MEHKFPLRLFVATYILAFIFFIGLIISVLFTWETVESFYYQDMYLEEHYDAILDLDEMLTDSAQMAAATGSLEWEKKYNQDERKLDAILRQFIQELPGAEEKKFLQGVIASNIAMIATERAVFDYVKNGQLQQAGQLLGSPNYLFQKQQYEKNLQNVSNLLWQKRHDEFQQQEDYFFLLVITMGSCILFLYGFIWVKLRGSIKNWQKILEESNINLESKVQYRTLELQNILNQLKISQKELITASQMAMVGQLAGGIVHEINNPLGFLSELCSNLVYGGVKEGI